MKIQRGSEVVGESEVGRQREHGGLVVTARGIGTFPGTKVSASATPESESASMTYLPLHSAHALIDALVDTLPLMFTEVRPEDRLEAFEAEVEGVLALAHPADRGTLEDRAEEVVRVTRGLLLPVDKTSTHSPV